MIKNNKKETLIDLTDIGHNNPVKARRITSFGEETHTDDSVTTYPIPGIGIKPVRTTKKNPGLMRSASDPSTTNSSLSNAGFVFATAENEGKELPTKQGTEVIDPEPHEIERLEAAGATNVTETTFSSVTGRTTVKRGTLTSVTETY